MCPKSRSKKVLGTIQGAGSFWLTIFCNNSLSVIRSNVYSRVGQLSASFCGVLSHKHPWFATNYTTEFRNSGLEFSRPIQLEKWIPVVSNRPFWLPSLPWLKSNMWDQLADWNLKRRFGFQSVNSSAKMDSIRVKHVSLFSAASWIWDPRPSSKNQFFNQNPLKKIVFWLDPGSRQL